MKTTLAYLAWALMIAAAYYVTVTVYSDPPPEQTPRGPAEMLDPRVEPETGVPA